MTETMTGIDDLELPLVKAVLAATSLLESHREKVTSCTTLLEMAGHRARVGMIWAFTAGVYRFSGADGHPGVQSTQTRR